MDLVSLDVFVKVVQAGSFTAAAAALGTDKARLSRMVSALERELGTRLLERTTRALRLTESGRGVLERAQGILRASDDLRQFELALQAEPQGLLRLTCSSDFALVAANRWIAAFLQRWPRVELEAEFTSRRADLIHENIDLALRIGALDDSRLVARRLGALRYGLYASPAYIARNGAPEDLQQLAQQHALLMFTTGSGRSGWALRPAGAAGPEQRIDGTARLRSGSNTLLLESCSAGLGIARLPRALGEPAVAAGRLQPVLPGWEAKPAPVSAVFPSNRLLSPTVRAFIDLALAQGVELQEGASSP